MTNPSITAGRHAAGTDAELKELAQRVFDTAAAYKEAEDDQATGTHSGLYRCAVLYADYTAALHAHADYFIAAYIRDTKDIAL